jgi:hypothetical protein
LFEIALLLKASLAIALSAALIYCLGSPHMTYARFFYAEAAVECGILLAVWSYLRFFDARQWARFLWALLAGVGLAMAGASHYPHAPLVLCVWACLAVGFFNAPLDGKKWQKRTGYLVLFALVPLLTAIILMRLNVSRYGQVVPTGYQPEVATKISMAYIAGNMPYLGRMLLRTPWFAPALLCGIAILWKEKSARTRALACAMLSGVSAQQLFWLCYSQLPVFAPRYLHPMSALAALGLAGSLQWLHGKLPTRGVKYAMIVLLVSNAIQLFYDTIFLPFMRPPAGRGLWMYTWYMQPVAPGAKFDAGSPAEPLQYIILGTLLFCGLFAIFDAKKDANAEHESW